MLDFFYFFFCLFYFFSVLLFPSFLLFIFITLFLALFFRGEWKGGGRGAGSKERMEAWWPCRRLDSEWARDQLQASVTG